MTTCFNGLALALVLIAVSAPRTAQAQPEDRRAENKEAVKGDQDGQGRMGGG